MRATHIPLPDETPGAASDRLRKAASQFVWLAEEHEAKASAYRDRAWECLEHAANLRKVGAS